MSDLITKHRPKVLEDLIGCESTVKALRSIIKSKSSRAFLFVGAPGVGKTTIARIVAAEMGCSSNNIIEVDAATKSGVDDARELTSVLQFIGLGSGKRAIIYDECQAASKPALQALLKSVEEPPAGAYWFFCTTEISKVPETLKTRCTVFNLLPAKKADIVALLERVESKELFQTSESVLKLIARESHGSYRRALSLLTKCAGLVYTEDAAELLASVEVDDAEIKDLCQLLVQGKPHWAEAVALVKRMKGKNAESIRIVVCTYIESVLFNTSEDSRAGYLCEVLDAFAEPYPPVNGLYPVLMSLGRVVLQ